MITKIVATCDAMCWFFWDAISFCNKFMLPKRRFWKSERTFGNAFSKHFSKERSPNRVLTLWKVLRKCVPNSLRQLTPVFDKPAFSRFSQLFQPRIVVHIFGKIVKMKVCQKGGWVADGWFPNVRSAIQNLRLGSIKFARWLQKIVATCDAMCWVFYYLYYLIVW